MTEYKPFAEWAVETGAIVKDHLGSGYVSLTHVNIYGNGRSGDYVALTPTDIKRLMECVERWEASDERSES